MIFSFHNPNLKSLFSCPSILPHSPSVLPAQLWRSNLTWTLFMVGCHWITNPKSDTSTNRDKPAERKLILIKARRKEYTERSKISFRLDKFLKKSFLTDRSGTFSSFDAFPTSS